MKNELDMDLVRLFEEKSEPTQGEIFVEQVTRRIARYRRIRRGMRILLSLSGLTLIAILAPWLANIAGYIALGSSLIANTVMSMIFSPISWAPAIGVGVGLVFFLKARF